MNKSVFLYFMMCALSLGLTSCATLINGSHQEILVESKPAGARIFLDDKDTQRETPAEITVRRRSKAYSLKLERSGYETTHFLLQSRLNTLVVLDFFCYIVPGIIDVCVGAQHKYDNRVEVPLSASTSPVLTPVDRVAVNRSKDPYLFNRLSDVDAITSTSKKINDNRFALIIGNEDYTSFQRDLNSEVNVSFARDDASAFNDYAQKLLGIPERNITFLLDATAAEMRQGMAKMNLISKNSSGRAELFIFYAGHGLPDEVSKEPYLMPVDVSGQFVKLGIPLKELYSQLTEYPTERTTVFIDACFSGGARNQGLIASRGVKIIPKNESVKGNMVVFAASDADESALPYSKKNHGLFTYHLLQKLKETEGALTYKDLADYMEQRVSLEAVIINNKEQHPKTILSPDVIETWQTWAFR